jgi:hypothetical protein
MGKTVIVKVTRRSSRRGWQKGAYSVPLAWCDSEDFKAFTKWLHFNSQGLCMKWGAMEKQSLREAADCVGFPQHVAQVGTRGLIKSLPPGVTPLFTSELSRVRGERPNRNDVCCGPTDSAAAGGEQNRSDDNRGVWFTASMRTKSS